MHKPLILIDTYSKQTTKDSHRKPALTLTAISIREVLNIEVVIILTTSSLLGTTTLVVAVNSCIFRYC